MFHFVLPLYTNIISMRIMDIFEKYNPEEVYIILSIDCLTNNGVRVGMLQDHPGAKALVLSRAPAISFEGVDFGYLPDKPLFRGLTLDIPSGANVAFVGSSGCG